MSDASNYESPDSGITQPIQNSLQGSQSIARRSCLSKMGFVQHTDKSAFKTGAGSFPVLIYMYKYHINTYT